MLVENRNGLIAAAMVTHADGYAERDAALLMLQDKQQGRAGLTRASGTDYHQPPGPKTPIYSVEIP